MTSKSKTGCLVILIKAFITFPIWYFLMYTMLDAVNADSLAWFLFWAYVPLNTFACILAGIATSDE